MDETPIVITQAPNLAPVPKRTMSAGLISLLFVVMFVVVLVMYIGTMMLERRGGQMEFTSEKTIVHSGDINASFAQDKLPPQFPPEIPVETETVLESTRVQYSERGVTQYSVVYVSSKTKDEAVALYENFFTNNGYQITERSSQNDGNGEYLLGQKDDNDVSVVINSIGDAKVQVYVTYLER